MSDKDQFIFEDDDDYPETNLEDMHEPKEVELNDEDFLETNLDDHDLDDQDESPELDLGDEDDFPEAELSAAFLEGELVAEESVLDVAEPKVKGEGNPRTRTLLMVLLLVIAGGAGAYYFLGLGGTAPSVPTVPVPAQKTTKSVALPATPAKAPAAQANVDTTAKTVTVAVPPTPPAAESAAQVPPATKSIVVATPQAPPAAIPVEKMAVTKPEVEPAKQPATQVAVSAPQPKVAKAKAAPGPAPVLAPQKAALPVPSASTPAPSTKAAAPFKQVAGGPFSLDAGSFLIESNRDSLVAKIKELGYEPLVTPVDATLDMTRLRLGTFSKGEVQEALDFARSIEPGAYSAPAGDGYVVYAGTFLRPESVDKLSQRFLKEGVKVHPEPVQVVRTLSRIRFGSFATKEAATVAARELSQSGLKSVVVKSK